MDSRLSVRTHQSFHILDAYNGGTHQNFQKGFLDSSNEIATSIPGEVSLFTITSISGEVSLFTITSIPGEVM
jgi:hypothetical protein